MYANYTGLCLWVSKYPAIVPPEISYTYTSVLSVNEMKLLPTSLWFYQHLCKEKTRPWPRLFTLRSLDVNNTMTSGGDLISIIAGYNVYTIKE